MPSRISRIKNIALHAAAVIAFLTGIPGAALAQSDVCIPAIGSGLVSAPTIDGRVDGDPGWAGAVRVNLKELTGAPRVGTMQLGRAGGNLYISFEVEGTPTPAFDDLVVLGFQTTTNAAQDWRVHVHPFTLDDTGAGRSVYLNDDPRTRDFWRNSATWNLTSTATPTPGTSDTPMTPFIGDIKVSRNANNWAMEMRIPTSSNIADAAGSTLLYLPPSATTFKLYVNVLSTFDLAPTVTFTQDPWPQGVAMLTAGAAGSGGNFASNRSPAPGTWGTASAFTRSVCTGVYLAWNSSNGVRQTPTGAIGYNSRTGPGPFRSDGSGTIPAGTILTTPAQCEANLVNNTAWPSGTVLPNNYFVAKPGNTATTSADRVYVKFYVAPWGIPGAFDAGAPDAYWHPLGELYQPTGAPSVHSTTPEAVIPPDVFGAPALAAPLSTPSWQLSYKQACVYTKSYGYGSLGHHCIQAEVASNNPAVVIQNKSVVLNHNFLEASAVERDAQISVKGRGAPAVKGKPHELILFSQKVIQTFRRVGQSFHAASIKGGDAPAATTSTPATAPSGTVTSDTGAAPTVVGPDAGVPRPVVLASAQVPAQFRALGPVPADLFPKGVDEGMTVITNAYLKRPDSMIIGSKTYQYAQYVGGYSYFAGHAGVPLNWVESIALAGGPAAKTAKGNTAALQDLDAKGLQAKAPKALPINVHSLQIPEDDTVALAVRAEAQEERKPEPPQPCGCLDFSCRARADAGGVGTLAGLFLIGGIGIGGLAFVRRRKGKQEEAADSRRES